MQSKKIQIKREGNQIIITTTVVIMPLTVSVGLNGVEAYRVGSCENRSALVQDRDEQEQSKGRTEHCADASDRDVGLVGRHDLSLCEDGKPRGREREVEPRGREREVDRGASISMPPMIDDDER